MVRITGNDKLDNGDDFISPRLVFSDDASVVDYLYDLMASAPAINPDSGEIQFVHLPAWARQEQAGAAGTFVNKSLFFGAEHSNVEIEALRSENRTLKFKTELAEINAQVLRSENDTLNVKLADLAAQRDETKNSLDAVSTQNSDLLLRVGYLQTRLDLSEKNLLDISQQMAAERSHQETAMVSEKVTSTDQQADAAENTAAPNQDKEPLPCLAVPQEADPYENAVIDSPPVTILEPNPHQVDKISSGIDLDTAFLSRVHAVSTETNRCIDSNAAVFSRRTVVSAPVERSPKPASKVIKRQHGKEKQLSHKTDQALTILPQDSSPHARTNKEADLKPQFIQQLQTAEPQSGQAEGEDSDKNLLHCDNIDGIDQEPSPAPRIIVRRNVKNYEDLQKETEPVNRVKAGHAIIL